MIRINLLSTRRYQRPRGDSGWLAVVLGVCALTVALLFGFHQFNLQKLRSRDNANSELQKKLQTLQAEVKGHDELKKKLKQMRERRQAIIDLQSSRSGPTSVLIELSNILTQGKGPSIAPQKLAQLNQHSTVEAHNISWDTRRLRISKFKEKNKSAKIDGFAQDADDVSELARRLSLSPLFYDVVLLPARQQTDSETKQRVVSFQLEAKVRY